ASIKPRSSCSFMISSSRYWSRLVRRSKLESELPQCLTLETPAMPVSKNKIRLPSMTPGTARSIAWLRFGRAGARPKVYFQAAIHANELPGAMALHHLMPMLAEADRARRIRGEVIIVPTVNPIGQSQLVGNNHLGRYDLLSRDNFNRNWLDLPAPGPERVAKQLARDPAANVALIRKAALAALQAMKPVNE